MSNPDTFESLLNEVAGNYTRDDALPNNLLVRIDAALSDSLTLNQELAYLRAQGGLLEAAQQEAVKLRAEIAEIQRPLDAQMARLNENLTAANLRIEVLTAELAAAKVPFKMPPLDDELSSILGTMCFECIPFTRVLRAAGYVIDERAETEQAAVLHFKLGFYFEHGANWRQAARTCVEAMRDKFVAEREKGGAA